MSSMTPGFEKRDWVNLDITHRCGLECPRCLRQWYRKRDLRIPGEDMSIEIFEKVVDHYSMLIFCGQISDPIHHPKFIDFLKMAYSKNKRVSVHTASSLKSMKWFIEAFEANVNATWTFGIDGLPKESHKYRVNKDVEKLYQAMVEARYILKDRPVWQYIPFSYNETHIDEAKKMAEEADVVFALNISSRWWYKNDELMPKNPKLRLDNVFNA